MRVGFKILPLRNRFGLCITKCQTAFVDSVALFHVEPAVTIQWSMLGARTDPLSTSTSS